MSKEIAIIGAGAAGLTAAFYASGNPANHVTVYEKNEIVGKKLRITGNGRCNISNRDLSITHYMEESEDSLKVWNILQKNPAEAFTAFLEACGSPVYEKNGYYYPLAERAGELCDLIEKTLLRKGVFFMRGETVREIGRLPDGKFQIGDNIYDAVILSCGGKAAPATGSDGGGFRLARAFGHTVTYTYPVLVPLKGDAELLKIIAGVRVKGRVYGMIDGSIAGTADGEIQFTESTISGIPVFNVSRHLTKAIEEKKNVCLCMDFLPEYDTDYIEAYLERRRKQVGDLKPSELFEGILPKKLYEFLLKEYPGQDPSAEEILAFMKHTEFRITAHEGYENAQCTKGGVELSEVTESLESVLVPNLYIIGEMLDVDGDCGGYNLQWAFSGGKTVGDMLSGGGNK